jgi:O-antigen/teichoic acid export membrane protein
VIAIYDAAYGVSSLVGTVLVLAWFPDLMAIAWVYAGTGFLAGLVKALIAWIIYRRKLRWAEIVDILAGWKGYAAPWKEIRHFVLGVNFAATIRYMVKNIDVLILGKFVTTEAVGVYNLARKTSNLFAYFTDPLSIVIYPEFARNWASGMKARLRHLFWSSTLYSGGGVTIAYLGMVVTSHWWLSAVFGVTYVGAEGILWVLMPGTVCSVGLFATYYMLLAMGKSRSMFLSAVVRAVVLGAGLPILISLWESKGAALAVVLSVIASHAFCLVVISRGLKEHGMVPAV